MEPDLPELHAHALESTRRCRRRGGRRPVAAARPSARAGRAGAREPHRDRQLLGGRARPGSDHRGGGRPPRRRRARRRPARRLRRSAWRRRRRSGRRVRWRRRARCRTDRSPGEVYCGHRLLDVLIHGWDVAIVDRTGHHARPRAGRGVLSRCVEPQRDMLVGSGMFGDVRSRCRQDRAAARPRLLADARRRCGERADPGVSGAMGQFITVTVRPGVSPSVRIFDLNRSLTGMAIERYRVGPGREGRRPPARRARPPDLRPRAPPGSRSTRAR